MAEGYQFERFLLGPLSSFLSRRVGGVFGEPVWLDADGRGQAGGRMADWFVPEKGGRGIIVELKRLVSSSGQQTWQAAKKSVDQAVRANWNGAAVRFYFFILDADEIPLRDKGKRERGGGWDGFCASVGRAMRQASAGGGVFRHEGQPRFVLRVADARQAAVYGLMLWPSSAPCAAKDMEKALHKADSQLAAAKSRNTRALGAAVLLNSSNSCLGHHLSQRAKALKRSGKLSHTDRIYSIALDPDSPGVAELWPVRDEGDFREPSGVFRDRNEYWRFVELLCSYFGDRWYTPLKEAAAR